MATIHHEAVKEARRLAFVRERTQRGEATLLKEAEARGRQEGVALGELSGFSPSCGYRPKGRPTGAESVSLV